MTYRLKKQKITTKCCFPPRSVGVLTHAQNTPSEEKRVSCKSPVFKRKLPKHLQSLCRLADVNDFDKAIEEQLRKDRVDQPTQRVNNKAHVMIRKKQTHMELITYLHASCFSPVRSTFRNAIKKGSSKHGQGSQSTSSINISQPLLQRSKGISPRKGSTCKVLKKCNRTCIRLMIYALKQNHYQSITLLH